MLYRIHCCPGQYPEKSLLSEHSLIHAIYSVCILFGIRFVCDKEYSCSFVCAAAQQAENSFGIIVIQIRRRLVGEDDPGLYDQCPRNGKASSLTAGEFIRINIRKSSNSDFLKE